MNKKNNMNIWGEKKNNKKKKKEVNMYVNKKVQI